MLWEINNPVDLSPDEAGAISKALSAADPMCTEHGTGYVDECDACIGPRLVMAGRMAYNAAWERATGLSLSRCDAAESWHVIPHRGCPQARCSPEVGWHVIPHVGCVLR